MYPKAQSTVSGIASPSRRTLFRNIHVARFSFFLSQAGSLSKLGGPLKTWKKRWFVLRDGRLHYYKHERDVLRRKVKGEVVLDEAARLQKTNEGKEKVSRAPPIVLL